MRKKTGNLILYAILIILLAVVIFPLFYTLMASFKSNAEILVSPGTVFPKKPTFDNYITVWNSPEFDVKTMLWNSIYYTVILVAASLLTSSMAGFVFSRAEFPGKKIIFCAFSALMFIHLGSITIYPLFDILTRLKLNQSLWGLIVYRVFSVNVVNIYLVRSFVNSLPKELDEAARLDGCNFIQTFFRIIAPLLKPVLATVGILSFQGSWNEYLMPTIFTMNNPSQRTLIAGVVALKTSGEAATQWNLMLAGSIIALVPVLVAYAIGNRYFVSGLAAGAVKG